MSGEPLVSVVTPCFNRAYAIADAVRSVQAQTWTTWELLIIDDASTDDLSAALAEFHGDGRIRVIRHAANRGVSAARNTGVAAASGRFIAFLDSDDSWAPRKLEDQVTALLAQPAPDAALCVTQARVVMPGGWSRIRPLAGPAPGQAWADFLYRDGGLAQASTFMLSAALARAHPFVEGLRQYEDHLFFIQLGASGAQYVLVAQPLSVWRNDDRPDRLSAEDNLARAAVFLDHARALAPPATWVAFRLRVLGAQLWATAPWTFAALVLQAAATGALPPKQFAILVFRAVCPKRLYAWLIRRLTARPAEPASARREADARGLERVVSPLDT